MSSNSEIAFWFASMVSALALAIASGSEWARLSAWGWATGAAWFFMVGFLSVIRPTLPIEQPETTVESDSQNS
jgi:hypothetical protein